MSTRSGLTNEDVRDALSSLREMYGLNVVVSVRLELVHQTRIYLRVEWSPVTIWKNQWYAAAELGAQTFVNLPLAAYEPLSPGAVFRALMAAETEIERYYRAAVAAGKPPEPQ